MPTAAGRHVLVVALAAVLADIGGTGASADSINSTYDMNQMLSEPHPLAGQMGTRWQPAPVKTEPTTPASRPFGPLPDIQPAILLPPPKDQPPVVTQPAILPPPKDPPPVVIQPAILLPTPKDPPPVVIQPANLPPPKDPPPVVIQPAIQPPSPKDPPPDADAPSIQPRLDLDDAGASRGVTVR